MRGLPSSMVAASSLAALISIAVPSGAADDDHRVSAEEDRDQCAESYDQKRDLSILRDLDHRVKKGELSERERQLLWQAHLARISSSAPSLDESEARKHEYDTRCGLGFVGPAF